MTRLDKANYWDELLSLKDKHSLRELAERYGVTPGAISATMRRQGVHRTPMTYGLLADPNDGIDLPEWWPEALANLEKPITALAADVGVTPGVLASLLRRTNTSRRPVRHDEPPVEATAPVETTAPVEAPPAAPVVETPAPVVETPAPVVETPAPVPAGSIVWRIRSATPDGSVEGLILATSLVQAAQHAAALTGGVVESVTKVGDLLG